MLDYLIVCLLKLALSGSILYIFKESPWQTAEFGAVIVFLSVSLGLPEITTYSLECQRIGLPYL